MHTLFTQIDIAASPAEVRKALLDFDDYPTWAMKTFIKSIQVTSGEKENLKPGDVLKVAFTGMSFSPVVQVNTPEQFRWRGSLFGVFNGEHSFHFKPSTNVTGHTTLLQQEDFSGILSFLVGPDWSEGKKTKANFEKFNEELKERLEHRQS